MNYPKIIPLIARAFLAIIFIQSGIGKIFNFAGTQETIAGAGLPFPAILLVLTILVEVAGGLMVLLGAKARLGALLLVLFLIPATLVFHNPIADPSQLTQFLKNLAIMGGLLMVFSYGPGLMSLENPSDSAKLSQ